MEKHDLKGVAREIYNSLEAITGVHPKRYPLKVTSDPDFAGKAEEDIQDWAKSYYDIDIYDPKYEELLEELDLLLNVT